MGGSHADGVDRRTRRVLLPLLQSVLERIPAGTVSLVTAPHEISIQTRILVDSEISHEFSLKGRTTCRSDSRSPAGYRADQSKAVPAWQVFQNWEPTERVEHLQQWLFCRTGLGIRPPR